MTLVGRLHRALGTPGLLIAGISVVSFGFGLIILLSEYNWLRDTGRDTLRQMVAGWVRTLPVDYLGRTLADYADQWQRSSANDRPARLEALKHALEVLGTALDRHGEQFPMLTVLAADLSPKGEKPVARWWSSSRRMEGASKLDHVPVLASATGRPIELTVWYRLAPDLEAASTGLETSYHRLLLALLGLSGYSLLCLAYMVLYARGARERVARESAQQATLDLADRTCHELGNVVFVLANERRNLADHLSLIERFVHESPAAWDAAVRRAEIEPAVAARLRHALEREFAERGIDPGLELLASTAVARDVCRQIEVCSEYIALTVRELDSYLKQSAVPITLGPVDVYRCFDDAIALLGPRLEAASAQVERPEPAGARPLAQADRRLLVHVLVNLLKNAVEAALGAGIEPRIQLSARAEDSTLWIGVADNGPGISESELPRLFDLGYSTKGMGRGRGLAIVQESVLAQGGEIKVQSEPGRGTSFQIGLPLADGHAASSPRN